MSSASNPAPAPATPPAGETWTLRDGSPVLIRPICPEDEPMMVAFHQSLSLDTVYSRYFEVFQLSQRVDHQRLQRVCHPEPGHDHVLIALAGEGDQRKILGVGRLSIISETKAEFAVLVADAFQGKGLGSELLRRVLSIARALGLRKVTGEVLRTNLAMQRICERAGMTIRPDRWSDSVHAELTFF